jgi:hypothetical protein
VLLIELGSPALRQRRLVGRRLILGLGRRGDELSGRSTTSATLAALAVVAIATVSYEGIC